MRIIRASTLAGLAVLFVTPALAASSCQSTNLSKWIACVEKKADAANAAAATASGAAANAAATANNAITAAGKLPKHVQFLSSTRSNQCMNWIDNGKPVLTANCQQPDTYWDLQ